MPSRLQRCPCSTMPPMRNVRALGASFAAHLRRRVEEHEVALERVEHQRGGGADGADDAGGDRDPLVARLHRGAPPSSRRARRWRSTTSTGSTAMQASVTA